MLSHLCGGNSLYLSILMPQLLTPKCLSIQEWITDVRAGSFSGQGNHIKASSRLVAFNTDQAGKAESLWTTVLDENISLRRLNRAGCWDLRRNGIFEWKKKGMYFCINHPGLQWSSFGQVICQKKSVSRDWELISPSVCNNNRGFGLSFLKADAIKNKRKLSEARRNWVLSFL